MNDPFEYLDTDDLVDLASRLLGDPPPIRDIGLLGSAAARPRTSAFGEDAYPDLWSKAAALLHSVVKNHALIDGNKRLGWLATATFLEINSVGVTHVGNDAVYDLGAALLKGRGAGRSKVLSRGFFRPWRDGGRAGGRVRGRFAAPLVL